MGPTLVRDGVRRSDPAVDFYGRSCGIWLHPKNPDGSEFELLLHVWEEGRHWIMREPNESWNLQRYVNVLAKLCVCCGNPHDWCPPCETEPVAIGEGVEVCGMCAKRWHHDCDGTPTLLAGVLAGKKLWDAGIRPAQFWLDDDKRPAPPPSE